MTGLDPDPRALRSGLGRDPCAVGHAQPGMLAQDLTALLEAAVEYQQLGATGGVESYLGRAFPVLETYTYNLTRVMNIIGIRPLMAAIRA